MFQFFQYAKSTEKWLKHNLLLVQMLCDMHFKCCILRQHFYVFIFNMLFSILNQKVMIQQFLECLLGWLTTLHNYYIDILHVTQLYSNAHFYFHVSCAHFNSAFNIFTFLCLAISWPFFPIPFLTIQYKKTLKYYFNIPQNSLICKPLA